MNPLHWDHKTLRRNGLMVLTLICMALVVHEVFGQNGIIAMRRQAREIKIRKEQILKLKQENQKLKHQIQALKSNPQAIEKLAREQMHMAKPGELIYTLPQKQTTDQPDTADRSNPPKP